LKEEETMPQYHLDVAFSSDATPNDPTLPIAMAYGFTNDASGSWLGAGQTKESVPANSPITFYIFDTASDSTFSISSVTIASANKNPGQGSANSPFSDQVWSTGTITASDNPSGPTATQLNGPQNSGTSTGCNVSGRVWSVGPFTVESFSNPAVKFEITVTVEGTVNGVTRKFQVDPEVVVEGSNK
jgi:hypothetical protein